MWPGNVFNFLVFPGSNFGQNCVSWSVILDTKVIQRIMSCILKAIFIHFLNPKRNILKIFLIYLCIWSQRLHPVPVKSEPFTNSPHHVCVISIRVCWYQKGESVDDENHRGNNVEIPRLWPDFKIVTNELFDWTLYDKWVCFQKSTWFHLP